MTATRKQVRKQFGVLLQDLVTDGVVQAVYAYPAADFAGQSPVVTLFSGGTGREPLGMMGQRTQRIGYELDVYVFTLYAVVDPETGAPTLWLEDDAADAQDDIEQAIADIIADHQREVNYWHGIAYRGPTETDIENIGGQPYLRERIALRFAEFSG
jgi:hypothetical protein